MWGYVSSIRFRPTDNKADDYIELLDSWEADNTKIIT